MSDSSLTDLILSLTLEDGSSIGNGAMMALLRERVPSLTHDDYFAARDALVDGGLVARGRGRGGSLMRVTGTEDEDADEEVDGFELAPPTSRRHGSARPRSGSRPRAGRTGPCRF